MEFNFNFPEVENAYKPSGRITFLSILLMLLLGGAISLIGGYLLGAVLPKLDNLSREGGVLGLIIEILLKLVLSLGLGYGIAFGVYQGGKMGKNRNAWIGIVIGGICGLAAFIITLSVGGANPEYGGSTIGPLMGVAMFCAIVVGPAIWTGGGAATDPFCELHNRFMKETEISKLPIYSERNAMNFLSSREFEKIVELSPTDDLDNYSTIQMYYCDECMKGYISMRTKLTIREQESDGSSYSKSESRLVFSSSLDSSEVKTILKAKIKK